VPVWETRDLGCATGRCASCGEVAELHLRESAYRRRWTELLSEIDERVDRRVTCSRCRRTYPVLADGQPDVGRRAPGSRPSTG
jgi:hypothetical protein